MKIPERLYNSIVTGNCVLFVGAGASIEAGAPSAQRISQELAEKYLKGQHTEESLPRVASYIEKMPGLGRRVVAEHLLNRLTDLEPSEAHLRLPMFDWAAIYTTNYDTLIEQAYRKIRGDRIRCRAVICGRDLVNDSSDESPCIIVFKPHGCITRPFSDEAPMVVSEDDYYRGKGSKGIIYKRLELHKLQSIFLYVGYSFSDFNLSQVWFDVLNEMGKSAQWAYALWPGCSEAQQMLWRERYVELIDARFGEFMTELSSMSSRERKRREFSIGDTATAEFVDVLLSVMEARDPFLKAHSLRVQRLALMIGEEMALPFQEYRELETAALIHDIGHMGVPSGVIGKQGPLSEAEYELIRRHTIFGEQLLSRAQILKRFAKTARSHHEMLNGQGYPDGLLGQAIPRLVRVIAVADTMDALMCSRPYKRSYGLEESLAIIRKDSGTRYDPAVVDALNSLHLSSRLTQFWTNENGTL